MTFDIGGHVVAVNLDDHEGASVTVRCIVDEDVARRLASLMLDRDLVHVVGTLPSESKSDG